MSQFGSTNIYDALKNAPRDRIAVARNAEGKPMARVIKRPEGRMVEEFVDPTGNVVWVQTLQLGTDHGIDEMDRKRAHMRREGFVEYAKCPCLSGARAFTPELAAEFREMPAELQNVCEDDPQVYERRGTRTHLHDPCPHVKWLIATRRERAAQEQALRATRIDTVTDIEKQKLEISAEQLAESRAQNQRLLDILEKLMPTQPMPTQIGPAAPIVPEAPKTKK